MSRRIKEIFEKRRVVALSTASRDGIISTMASENKLGYYWYYDNLI